MSIFYYCGANNDSMVDLLKKHAL